MFERVLQEELLSRCALKHLERLRLSGVEPGIMARVPASVRRLNYESQEVNAIFLLRQEQVKNLEVIEIKKRADAACYSNNSSSSSSKNNKGSNSWENVEFIVDKVRRSAKCSAKVIFRAKKRNLEKK